LTHGEKKVIRSNSGAPVKLTPSIRKRREKKLDPPIRKKEIRKAKGRIGP